MDIESMIPPPGEEGFSASHVGDEVTIYQELEALTIMNTWRFDTCDCSGHIALLASDWASQYEALMDTLLNYMHKPIEPMEPPSSDEEIFTIEVVDIFAFASLMEPQIDVYYCRHLAGQLHISYDVYLELHWHIDHSLDKVLGHDSNNWWMLNPCPACQYKLTDELALTFSILCTCDGNNYQEHLDTQIGTSSMWLSELYVDTFKDECPSQDPDDPWVDEPSLVDSAELHTVCVDHWHNAAPESQKKMFAIFKKSGIFITVC
ncbi:hypothetical protein BDR05DRAFT_978627 [Suillus weaverae]|nr:hypothetical protein BDR05DRAFT_978627 [Suillus weaverae]